MDAGRWRSRGIYFLSRSAYQVPPSVLDPPLTAAEARAGAPQPAARFSCRGRTVQDLHDPAGDAPRSLDVRRLVALVDEPGNVCFRIAFAARPEPGTLVDVELEQPIPGDRRGTFHVIAFGVRIGHAGVLRVGSTRSRVPPPVAAGWHDGELTLLWRAPRQRLDGHNPFRISLKVESFQRDEPFVRDPLEARDSVGAPRT